MNHGWQYLAIFLVLFHFFVPFFLLLSRDNKRASSRLVMIAAWIIFVRYVDIFMLVTPDFGAAGNLHMLAGEHESHFFVHWLDLAAPVAIGGLWVGCSPPSSCSVRCWRSAIRTCANRFKAQEATDGRPLWAGHHSSPDDEYAFTPEGAAYEHTDAAVGRWRSSSSGCSWPRC
jgi:hypothetical protein